MMQDGRQWLFGFCIADDTPRTLMMQDGRQWLFGFSIESDTPRALTGQAEADSHLILLSRATHRGR